jgi:hypothetical protein
MANQYIIFPTEPFLDKDGKISKAWTQWLLNPQFVSIVFKGTISAVNFPILSGDVTTPGLSLVTTLVNVIAAGGPIGDPTTVPVITYDSKGRLITVGTATITPAAIGSPSGSGTSTGSNTGDQTNITGNAATVTTNANLTGPITSTGNATAVAVPSVSLIAKVVASGRATAQVAANPNIVTYALGAADGSFEVSANVNVTTATLHNFTVTCVYTDETNTSRTLTMGFTQLAGATLLSAITNVTGAGPYEGIIYHLRCKASTAITIATTGTFTTVTYNAESIIKQTV